MSWAASALPMPSPESPLDPVLLLVACRRLDAAEELANRRLAGATNAEPPDRLALAKATKTLADVLLEADRKPDAAPHVYEARRRYRPFRNDVALSAEVDLTLATFAVLDDRSLEGEQILAEAIAASTKAEAPATALPLCRLLRYSAHLQVIRGEFDKGDALVTAALDAVLRAPRKDGSEASLLLSQCLFTQGEIAFIRDDVGRALDATRRALDVAETELRSSAEYVQFARRRAAHAHRVFGDMAAAEALEAKAEGRHG